jgi:AcrR family transcriptional regulator
MRAATAELLSPEKRDQILRGAAAVFSRDGYEGASVARIAQEAGVSKGTLYNHFDSKAAMFAAWVAGECAERLAVLFADGGGEEDPAPALAAIGTRMIGMMLSFAGETIYRMVISEAGKFPELARAFFDAGPSRAIGFLSARLSDWTARGMLEVADPDFAAEQFFTLCQTRIVMRKKLHLLGEPTEDEIAHVVDEAVRMFLNTYGTRR